MSSTIEIEKFLVRLDIFKTFNDKEIRKIVPGFKLIHSQKDDVLVHEDEVANQLYIVKTGSVAIWKNFNKKNAVRLAVQTACHVFGELSLIDDQPRSATAVVLENSQILCLSKKNFLDLCDTHPQIMFSVMKVLSATLRVNNSRFISNLSRQNTELQHTLEKLKETQQELIQAELFSNLGKLSSMIIHDFRNPLSIIKGYSEMLQAFYNKPEQVKEYSKKIVTETVRLNQFAQELLDYTRGDIRLNWGFSSLQMIFQKIEESLARSLRDLDIVLDVSYKGEIAFYMDESRIMRAIHNICDNARKAMPEGGTLHIVGELEGNEIAISITDTGHGMDGKTQANIFKPFYSLSGGGTGLGMLSVKTVVEAHGGKVVVESSPGEGTTVSLILPYHKALPREPSLGGSSEALP